MIWKTAATRAWQMVVTLLFVSFFTFLLVPLSPGSPAASILQYQGRRVTPEAIRIKEHELGLDQPLLHQYVRWLSRTLRGDLGRSWKTQLPVRTLIGERLPPTLLLGVVSLVLGLVISLAVAMTSARFHDRAIDHGLRLGTLVFTAIPTFVLGLLVLDVVVVRWGFGQVIADGTMHTVWLPAAVLAAVGVAGWSRPLRGFLLDAAGAPYSRTMLARGASERRILWLHALPNATLPFLGLLGLGIGSIIGGAPIVEAVFSWPGLGAQVVQSVLQRDVPVIQAFVLLSTFGYLLGSLVADLVGAALDPRRTEQR